MISGIDGGKIGPTIAEELVTAAANGAEKPLLAHRVDLDAAEAADVGQRRARHAGEDQAAEDVDLRETARQPPDGRVGELVDVARDAGAVHQAADEEEHGHRHQRKRVERVERALRDQVDRQAVGEHVDDARNADRQHDRKAEHEQPEERDDDEESLHGRPFR